MRPSNGMKTPRGRSIVHSIHFREPQEYFEEIIEESGAGIISQSSGYAKKVFLRPSSLSAGMADDNALWVIIPSLPI